MKSDTRVRLSYSCLNMQKSEDFYAKSTKLTPTNFSCTTQTQYYRLYKQLDSMEEGEEDPRPLAGGGHLSEMMIGFLAF